MLNNTMTEVVITCLGDTALKSHSFVQNYLQKKPNQTSTSSRQSTINLSNFNIRPTINNSTTHENPNFSNLSHLWREIQGSNNWQNLVNPLHPLLRKEIIRYGQFVVACYKAFDLNPNSKRYLAVKFGQENMMNQVGLEDSGYEVTKYIYATPDTNIFQISNYGAKWIGYIAISNDDKVINRLGRRDIVVAFRGTVTNPEWLANFMSNLTLARLDPHESSPNVKVESGFLSLYTSSEIDNNCTKFGVASCREQLLSEISRLLNKYKGNNEEISISLAGHSMGSSLAILLGYDIAELGINKRMKNSRQIQVPITVFSFGGPRVGNCDFKKRCEELGVKVLRIVNVNDPITKLPGIFLNENLIGCNNQWSWCSCYAHVGVELVLDFFNMLNPSCVHDLDAYIELLKSSKRNNGVLADSDDDEDVGHEGYFDVMLSMKNVIVNNLVNLVKFKAESKGVKLLMLIDDNFFGCMNYLPMYIIVLGSIIFCSFIKDFMYSS